MRLEKLISEEETKNIIIPWYWRSRDEAIEPFQQEDFPLHLISSQIICAPNPLFQQFESDHNKEQFAKSSTNWFRAFFEGGVKAGFVDQEKVNILFDRMEEEIAKFPEKYQAGINSSVLYIEKW